MTIEQIAQRLQEIVRAQGCVDMFSIEGKNLQNERKQLENQAEEMGYFFSTYNRKVTVHKYSHR